MCPETVEVLEMQCININVNFYYPKSDESGNTAVDRSLTMGLDNCKQQ
jgi:hypothetical protein